MKTQVHNLIAFQPLAFNWLISPHILWLKIFGIGQSTHDLKKGLCLASRWADQARDVTSQTHVSNVLLESVPIARLLGIPPLLNPEQICIASECSESDQHRNFNNLESIETATAWYVAYQSVWTLRMVSQPTCKKCSRFTKEYCLTTGPVHYEIMHYSLIIARSLMVKVAKYNFAAPGLQFKHLVICEGQHDMQLTLPVLRRSFPYCLQSLRLRTQVVNLHQSPSIG